MSTHPPLFERLPPPQKMEWPSLQEVHAYRQQVYRVVSSVIQAALEEKISNITADSPYWALPMAMEHERIHVETSSVLIRELPLEHISRPATWPAPHVPDSDDGDRSQTLPPIENPLVRVEGGVVRLGKPKDFPRCVGWGYVGRTHNCGRVAYVRILHMGGVCLFFLFSLFFSCFWTEHEQRALYPRWCLNRTIKNRLKNKLHTTSATDVEAVGTVPGGGISDVFPRSPGARIVGNLFDRRVVDKSTRSPNRKCCPCLCR